MTVDRLVWNIVVSDIVNLSGARCVENKIVLDTIGTDAEIFFMHTARDEQEVRRNNIRG